MLAFVTILKCWIVLQLHWQAHDLAGRVGWWPSPSPSGHVTVVEAPPPPPRNGGCRAILPGVADIEVTRGLTMTWAMAPGLGNSYNHGRSVWFTFVFFIPWLRNQADWKGLILNIPSDNKAKLRNMTRLVEPRLKIRRYISNIYPDKTLCLW